jgi:hypothetical protein
VKFNNGKIIEERIRVKTIRLIAVCSIIGFLAVAVRAAEISGQWRAPKPPESHFENTP